MSPSSSFSNALLLLAVVLQVCVRCQARETRHYSRDFDPVESLMDTAYTDYDIIERIAQDDVLDPSAFTHLPEVPCGPHPEVVLVEPQDSYAVYKPMFIKLHRCRGACNQRNTHSCQPIKRDLLNIMVDINQDATTAEVYNHTKCACACKTLPTCTSGRYWNPNNCRCECSGDVSCGGGMWRDPVTCMCTRR